MPTDVRPASPGEDAQKARTPVVVVAEAVDLRTTLRLVLEDLGRYSVLAIAHRDSALALLRMSPRRLVVVLDDVMPRGDGAPLLWAILHGASLTERHVFICLTDIHPEWWPSDLLDRLARHRIALLAKPFGIGALLGAVRQAEQRLSAPLSLRVPRRQRSTADVR